MAAIRETLDHSATRFELRNKRPVSWQIIPERSDADTLVSYRITGIMSRWPSPMCALPCPAVPRFNLGRGGLVAGRVV